NISNNVLVLRQLKPFLSLAPIPPNVQQPEPAAQDAHFCPNPVRAERCCPIPLSTVCKRSGCAPGARSPVSNFCMKSSPPGRHICCFHQWQASVRGPFPNP